MVNSRRHVVHCHILQLENAAVRQTCVMVKLSQPKTSVMNVCGLGGGGCMCTVTIVDSGASSHLCLFEVQQDVVFCVCCCLHQYIWLR